MDGSDEKALPALRWLSDLRLSQTGAPKEVDPASAGMIEDAGRTPDRRTPFERDYDRVLFSAPVRRMADKTQVFPLDRHDSVRNRLTHSHEVSNLARSLGNDAVRNTGKLLAHDDRERSAIPVILAAVGLSHDVGNPPFGHQGEKAIGQWFHLRRKWIFDRADEGGDSANVESAQEWADEFLDFEGNAQSLRLLAKLQVSRDGHGLDLTFATLAASMKYTVGCDGVPREKGERTAANKKYGFFASEWEIFDKVKKETGLVDLRRNPLTWLMEAADDVAYSVLDVEDSIEKELVSFHEVKEALRRNAKDDVVMLRILAALEGARGRVEARGMTAPEEDDVYVQLLRSHAMSELVGAVGATFRDSWPAISTYEQTASLIEQGAAARLARTLQWFARENAFNNAGVLEVELAGRRAVLDLMDWFWIGISERQSFDDVASTRTSPFANLMYRRISENYRRVFEHDRPREGRGRQLPVRYRELRLLTDMISGMTDGYAMAAHAELKRIHAEHARK